jgi:hypothetical protein
MAFTEKGLAAIEVIRRDYSTTETFTAAKLGVAPAVLTSLAKDGYLIRQDTRPVSYICDAKCREKINENYPKSFAPYSAEEMIMQIKMTYQELVEYCINKYGRVSGTYFCTPEMKSANTKIKRGSEGLYVHHIMEDRAIMLGNPLFAREQPWEYQMPHNLVYCNIFEHLLLHGHITAEFNLDNCKENHVLPGIGGLFNHILPNIREVFLGNRNTLIENITMEDFGTHLAPYIISLTNTSLYAIFAALQLESIKQDNEAFLRYTKQYAIAMKNGGVLKDAKNSIIFSCIPITPTKDRSIKREDGRIYKSLEDAAKSICGGKGKAKKIKKAIYEHTKYGGFYWEWAD